MVKRSAKRDKRLLHNSMESDLRQRPDRLWEYLSYSRPSGAIEAITPKTSHVSDFSGVCKLFAKHFSSTVNPYVPQFNDATPCPNNLLLMSILASTIPGVVSAIKELAPKK